MITLIWVAVFVVFALAGLFGFELNVNKPIGVGPLPAVSFVIAVVALIVVIARLAA